jgi:hypothetical protein
MPSEATPEQPVAEVPAAGPAPERPVEPRPAEIGGRTKGLEPTRYGDWEKGGRCIDF